MNNSSLTLRFAAAAASMVISISLISGVARLAEPPVASSLLAQAGATAIVR